MCVKQSLRRLIRADLHYPQHTHNNENTTYLNFDIFAYLWIFYTRINFYIQNLYDNENREISLCFLKFVFNLTKIYVYVCVLNLCNITWIISLVCSTSTQDIIS